MSTPPSPTANPESIAASLAASLMDAPKTGLPVTIITGFLGSGKTTLLNHILTNQQGVKTAVLVNEFGEIGIDNELIVNTSDDNTMVELSNGCVCCTINEDLMNAVYKIMERPEKVDYMIVETTGLADPLPVALTFLGSELRDLTRLDSIVTVVDAENFNISLFNSEVQFSKWEMVILAIALCGPSRSLSDFPILNPSTETMARAQLWSHVAPYFARRFPPSLRIGTYCSFLRGCLRSLRL